jgi:hypothetical protein
MEPAVEIAIATILGALEHSGKIDRSDISEIVSMLEYQAANRPGRQSEPLRSLAREICQMVP